MKYVIRFLILNSGYASLVNSQYITKSITKVLVHKTIRFWFRFKQSSALVVGIQGSSPGSFKVLLQVPPRFCSRFFQGSGPGSYKGLVQKVLVQFLQGFGLYRVLLSIPSSFWFRFLHTRFWSRFLQVFGFYRVLLQVPSRFWFRLSQGSGPDIFKIRFQVPTRI